MSCSCLGCVTKEAKCSRGLRPRFNYVHYTEPVFFDLATMDSLFSDASQSQACEDPSQESAQPLSIEQ